MMWHHYLKMEKNLSLFLRHHSVSFLRYAMGIIYFWYGALKVFNMSPVEELVYHATHWVGTPYLVEFLGVWEMLIGIFLFVKKWNRWGLILLFLQFPGTFFPLFLNPEDTFTAIPFGLTLEGQYILKNLVLISAGLVLISSLHEETQIK